MLKRLSLIFLLFTLSLFSCDNSKSYTLEELENNSMNNLGLRVESMDAEAYRALFGTFQSLNKEQVLKQLNVKDLELNHASFGFYYLANTCAAKKEMENTIKYHTVAADQYLNPQSCLKLAEFYFHVQKDYTKAYKYLHRSLEITIEITENNRSHPIASNGKDKAQYLLQELERMGERGVFDKVVVRTELKQELPPLMDKYREIYGLGPRVES